MPYISPEVVEQARQIDLLTYLQSCEPQELVRISGKNRFVHKLLCLQLRVFALLHCLPHIFMKIIDDLMSFFEICLGILELSLICTADY